MLMGSLFHTIVQSAKVVPSVDKRLRISSAHSRLLVVDGHWSITCPVLSASSYRSGFSKNQMGSVHDYC
jgi:hypothetical protein